METQSPEYNDYCACNLMLIIILMDQVFFLSCSCIVSGLLPWVSNLCYLSLADEYRDRPFFQTPLDRHGEFLPDVRNDGHIGTVQQVSTYR